MSSTLEQASPRSESLFCLDPGIAFPEIQKAFDSYSCIDIYKRVLEISLINIIIYLPADECGSRRMSNKYAHAGTKGFVLFSILDQFLHTN